MTDDAQPGATGLGEKKWLSPVQALTHFIRSPQVCDLTESSGDASGCSASCIRYGFRVGNIGLLLPADKLSEVIGDAVIHPIPTTPAWFSGLINLRGNLISVFDLVRLFGIDQEQDKRQFLLIVDRGDKAVGIPIKELPQAVPMGRRLGQLPALPSILRPHTRLAYVHEKDIWLDFDFEGLFSAVGIQMLD